MCGCVVSKDTEGDCLSEVGLRALGQEKYGGLEKAFNTSFSESGTLKRENVESGII